MQESNSKAEQSNAREVSLLKLPPMVAATILEIIDLRARGLPGKSAAREIVRNGDRYSVGVDPVFGMIYVSKSTSDEKKTRITRQIEFLEQEMGSLPRPAAVSAVALPGSRNEQALLERLERGQVREKEIRDEIAALRKKLKDLPPYAEMRINPRDWGGTVEIVVQGEVVADSAFESGAAVASKAVVFGLEDFEDMSDDF